MPDREKESLLQKSYIFSSVSKSSFYQVESKKPDAEGLKGSLQVQRLLLPYGTQKVNAGSG